MRERYRAAVTSAWRLFYFAFFLNDVNQYHAFGQPPAPLRIAAVPQFAFVNEDLSIGQIVPNVLICADRSTSTPLSLSLSGGDPLNYFKPERFNGTCWTVRLLRELDADQQNQDGSKGQTFSLTFRCSDGKVQAYANLDMQVMDINDVSPSFRDTPSQVTAPEDTSVGSRLFRVKTFDPDTGVGGIVNFRLKESYNGTFEIANGSCSDSQCTADVYLRRPLNYDAKSVYTLEIIATDGAGRIAQVNTARHTVVVTVDDVENQPPRFLSGSGVRYVKEDTPVGTNVFQVEAVDGDSGVAHPNKIVYSMLQDEAVPYFGINPSSGWVYVHLPIDRERQEILARNGALSLMIIAREDTPAPQPTSGLNITVIIEDVDDEIPRCNLSEYFAEVMENAQPLIPIRFLNANELYVFDRDEGKNGEFQVSLVGSNGVFDVSPKIVYNEANLLIRVQKSAALDYETTKSIALRVLNRGSGERPHQSHCSVIVNLLDANDNSPMFNYSIYNSAVLENQRKGTVVATVSAYDLDTAIYLPLVYNLSGDGSQRFSIDSNGTVRTREVLDREETSSYMLNVIAVDDGGRGNRNSVHLNVTVVDENDNSPVFKEETYMAYLPENSMVFANAPGGFFVKATDADQPGSENAFVTYHFLEPYSMTRNFSLNPYTGQISPNPPGIDLELLPRDAEYFNLTVVAQDAGRPHALSSIATVLIFVNDTNDHAPVCDQAQYNTSLFENATAGTILTRIIARDADRSTTNSQVAYRITTVQDKFVIDAQSGFVVVADGASLDRDLSKQDHYELEIVVVDQGFPQQSGSCKVNVWVLDINNKPPRFDEKLYHVDVSEDAPIHTFLLNVTARDPDLNPNLSYSISGIQRAEDEDGVNQASQNFTDWFSIDAQTGRLYTSNALDRELVQTIHLLLEVVDLSAQEGLPQTDHAVVVVNILDVNDNPPFWRKLVYSKTVYENAERGSTILSVSAYDVDKNRSIAYELKSDADGLLAIQRETGEIYVAGVIDYESIHFLNVTVIATDNGVPPLSSEVPVYIQVLDQNDNSPIFHPSAAYQTNVVEDAPPGTFVLRVNATDRDSGNFGRITYFILSEHTRLSPLFTIDNTTGEIRVAGELDRETKPIHVLTIQAIDDYTGRLNSDSHEATAIVEIVLTDVNDNAPEFTQNTPKLLTLAENSVVGQIVHTFSAIDRDDPKTGNAAVRYHLSGGNATIQAQTPINSAAPGEPMFTIDPKTGELSLMKNLSGQYGSYFLVIEAKDEGTPVPLASNVTVRIEILDYNDHAPVIIEPKKDSQYFVLENNYTDFMEISHVTARDLDHGLNAELRYSLKETVANEDWKYFTIDPISGKIYLKQALDYERQQRYSLTAKVCDLGAPQLCSEAEFAVVVLDVDDHCPVFEKNDSETVHAKENQPPRSIIGRISPAIDRDSAPENRKICYEIISGMAGTDDLYRQFRMASPNSTDIQALISLDHESRDVYELIVQTSDCAQNKHCNPDGRGERYATTKSLLKVRIEVDDDNDNAPVFVQSLFRGGVKYDTKLGSRATRVRASDKDTVIDREQLRYFFNGPIRAKLDVGHVDTLRPAFVLNSTTGDVLTNILFQPDWKGTFEVQITVNDSAGHEDYASVLINLLSFDQQVELIFDAAPNQVWEQAAQIISLLSTLTNTNATIDDVLNFERESAVSDGTKRRTEGVSKSSKVIAHFIQPSSGDVLSVDSALKLLDIPQTAQQRSAKQELISVHRLRYAGQNPQPIGNDGQSESTIFFGMGGVIAGLFLVVLVLIAVWCAQSKRYKRKLRAATTIAFGSADARVPKVLDVPGTNLHAGSNPVWSGAFGADNLGLVVEYDKISQTSRNSMDENAVDLQMERSVPTQINSDHALPRSIAALNGYCQRFGNEFSKHPKNGVLNGTAASKKTVQQVTPMQKNGSTVSSSVRNGSIHAKNASGGSSSKESSRGSLVTPAGRASLSPEPNFPRQILASLESTEL